MPVTPSSLNGALARAEQFLFGAPALEALLARRDAGHEDVDDAETVTLLVDEIFTFQREDGSFDGNLVRTAESLLLLRSLQPTPARDERCDRAVAWMLQQRDVPGRFAGTCDPAAHQLGVCSHFLTGFFSPGPREVPLDGLRFSNGLQFNSDDDARLAASARALRACLRWSSGIGEHIALISALEKIAAMIFRPVYRTTLGSAASLEVLAALIDLPPEGDHTTVVQGALSRLAALQRADGTWPELEALHVADVLLSAVTHDYASPAIQGALARAAALLVVTQHENGSWSNALDPQRTYIGWRVLRQVARTEVKE